MLDARPVAVGKLYLVAKYRAGFSLKSNRCKVRKRIGTQDYPHHLVISSTYKLPYQAIGGDGVVGHLKHALLGGWAASGTYLYQTGPPLSWGNVVYVDGRFI